MQNLTSMTMITCVDGILHDPDGILLTWIRDQMHTESVDTVTEFGPEKVLSDEPPSAKALNIRGRVESSIAKNPISTIILAAHLGCAWSANSAAEQRRQIGQSVSTIISWALPIERIVGVLLEEDAGIHVISDVHFEGDRWI